jgi:hypothetical protein
VPDDDLRALLLTLDPKAGTIYTKVTPPAVWNKLKRD